MAADILDAIDGALQDYETSGDAMRWTPDAAARCRGSLRRQQYVMVAVTVDMAPFMSAVQRLAEAMLPGMRRFNAAMAKLAANVSGGPEWHALLYPRSHRRQCRACNPQGNPPPVAGKFAPGPKAARMTGHRKHSR